MKCLNMQFVNNYSFAGPISDDDALELRNAVREGHKWICLSVVNPTWINLDNVTSFMISDEPPYKEDV